MCIEKLKESHDKIKSAVWGGFSNLLIPSHNGILRQDWHYTLLSYDPDIIITDDNMPPLLIKQLEAQIQPYHIWSRNPRDLFPVMPIDWDNFNNILMDNILHNEDFKLEHSGRKFGTLRIPLVSATCPYYKYIATQFGILTERIQRLCENKLQIQKVEFGSRNLYDYFAFLDEFEQQITPHEDILVPILLTQMQLSSPSGQIENDDYNKFTIFIILAEDNVTSGFCLFWNLRLLMASSLGSCKEILILPFSELIETKNFDAFVQWCNESLWHWIERIVLVSSTVHRRQIEHFRKRLVQYLGGKIKRVDIWFENFAIKCHTEIKYETKLDEEVIFKDGLFRLRVPEVDFIKQAHTSKWVVGLDIQNEGWETNSFLPPKYNGITELLSGQPDREALFFNNGYSTRYTNNKLACRVSSQQEYLSRRIPKVEEIFNSLLAHNGYVTEKTDKCRYAEGILNLFGGLQQLELFLKQTLNIVDLLDAMKNGNMYSSHEMKEFLKTGADSEKSNIIIRNLARRNIFLRGYRIQCPACDLTRWYAVAGQSLYVTVNYLDIPRS